MARRSCMQILCYFSPSKHVTLVRNEAIRYNYGGGGEKCQGKRHIFSALSGLKPGEGTFLFRSLRAKAHRMSRRKICPFPYGGELTLPYGILSLSRLRDCNQDFIIFSNHIQQVHLYALLFSVNNDFENYVVKIIVWVSVIAPINNRISISFLYHCSAIISIVCNSIACIPCGPN